MRHAFRAKGQRCQAHRSASQWHWKRDQLAAQWAVQTSPGEHVGIKGRDGCRWGGVRAEENDRGVGEWQRQAASADCKSERVMIERMPEIVTGTGALPANTSQLSTFFTLVDSAA